ncbi:basic phospholipase A2 homolog LmutTX-like isoform X1 [Ranitomeya imitator]|uniref:basic phospholipase A2 homolog LmutTX-like isoform X1 n=1 Tax=Ranitomeya imitator TaxID=111125 RepID=UPI0037E8372E
MITCLLLLLSLGSVEGDGPYLKDFRSMVSETMNRRVTDFNLYGCQCGILSVGSKIVDEIDRCCLAQFCMYKAISTDGCRPLLARYYYTYNNGTITCGRTAGAVDEQRRRWMEATSRSGRCTARIVSRAEGPVTVKVERRAEAAVVSCDGVFGD